MQPGAGDRREQLVAVRDGEHALAVGDVVDGTRHGSDDAERRAASRARSAASAGRGDRLDAAHLGSRADERAHSPALPRSTVTSTSARIRRAVSVRYGVAPAPTGSSTIGMPRRAAVAPASSIASTQRRERADVDHERTGDAAISSTSSGACAITGSAPSASVALAVSFMTT